MSPGRYCPECNGCGKSGGCATCGMNSDRYRAFYASLFAVPIQSPANVARLDTTGDDDPDRKP